MNISYGSVTLVEVLWTVSALPGLILWFSNLRSAQKDLAAVLHLGVIDSRLTWAKFAILKNRAFLLIECAFLGIGVTAMLQYPIVANPSHLTPTSYAMTIGLLGSSALMTFVGLRWRKVSKQLLDAARIRAMKEMDANTPVD